MVNGVLLDEMEKIIEKSTKQTVKQKRIIEAAISAFSEKGYSNTSTSELAKIAEVSEGTIFKHYATKENLLLSLIVPFLKDFFPTIVNDILGEFMNDKCSFEEFLRAFITNRSAFFKENREIFQVVIKEIIYKEELKNELLPYILENGYKCIVEVIEVFKQRGEVKEMPNSFIIKMLGSAIGGFFVSNFVLLNKQSVSNAEIEEMVFFILNGLGQPSQ